MEVKGTVTQIMKNDVLKAEVVRKSACGGNCHNCSETCGGKSEIFVKFQGTDEIKVGDTVYIRERSEKVLGISALLFILPLISIVIIYKLAFYFTKDDTVSAVTGFFSGVAVFLVFVFIFRKLKMPVCQKVERNN